MLGNHSRCRRYMQPFINALIVFFSFCFEMTYTVSSGTVNSSIPYHTVSWVSLIPLLACFHDTFKVMLCCLEFSIAAQVVLVAWHQTVPLCGVKCHKDTWFFVLPCRRWQPFVTIQGHLIRQLSFPQLTVNRLYIGFPASPTCIQPRAVLQWLWWNT